MPPLRYEALIRLIERHPHLPVLLLREVGGVEIPPGGSLSPVYDEWHDRVAVEVGDYINIFSGPEPNVEYLIIVEVATEISAEKLHQMALAAALLWVGAGRRPVHLLFITPDPGASRVSGPVELRGGSVSVVVDPVIVGPSHIPVLCDPKSMAADPLMAAFSAMAHGHRREVAEAFVKLLDDLPADDATELFGYSVDMAPPEVRRTLEETVMAYVPEHSSWAQNLYRQGKEHGHLGGLAEGLRQGRARGQANSVLSVLRHRGVEVPPERERQIRFCDDLERLDAWLQRALTASHIDDLFDDISESRSGSSTGTDPPDAPGRPFSSAGPGLRPYLSCFSGFVAVSSRRTTKDVDASSSPSTSNTHLYRCPPCSEGRCAVTEMGT